VAEASAVITSRGSERLRAGHLWIYRSDVRSASAEAGSIVRLTDERGRYQGRAFYSDRSQIAVRLLTREDVPVDRAFLTERIRRAAAYRKTVVENTQAYRLIYGEADLLPSLIVDCYGDYLVIQTLSQSTERIKSLICEILVELLSPQDEIAAKENGIAFTHDLRGEQKTGSFLDQRENHWAARQYAADQVLDCFAYQGGFSLTVAGHCNHVEGVDMSRAAVDSARRNQKLNSISNATFRVANAFDLLKEYDQVDRRFDMVVLDPPAFAKNRDSLPAAQRGYKEINLRAMKILKPGGYLVTCSCSYHMSEGLFLQVLAEAAIDARKTIAVIERRTQSRDHPILLTVPETHYLKCMILMVL
jgi:23S rRNA (cytosine1962-C5)-methyltransferase